MGLVKGDGSEVAISRIGQTGHCTAVYNMEALPDHDYLVGADGLVAHNPSGCRITYNPGTRRLTESWSKSALADAARDTEAYKKLGADERELYKFFKADVRKKVGGIDRLLRRDPKGWKFVEPADKAKTASATWVRNRYPGVMKKGFGIRKIGAKVMKRPGVKFDVDEIRERSLGGKTISSGDAANQDWLSAFVNQEHGRAIGNYFYRNDPGQTIAAKRSYVIRQVELVFVP
jgi:hypothetical protein